MKNIYEFMNRIQERLGGNNCVVIVCLYNNTMQIRVDCLNDFHTRVDLMMNIGFIPNDAWEDRIIENFENRYKMWEVGEI